MKPRYLWLVALAAVVGAALLTATAAASASAILAAGEQPAGPQVPGGPPPPPPPPPGRGGLDHAIFDLDLTQAQMEQVKALRDAARTASDPYEEQVGNAEKDIREAIESGSFDEGAVHALAVTQAKAIAELRVIQARTDSAIYKLLTAEQREALKTMRPPRPRRGPGVPF
jgi:Spy/CpxP family protein refolding chaperone